MRRAHDNPISAPSRRLITELDRTTLEDARVAAGRYSRDAVGFPMSLSEVLELFTAARVLARHMELGPGERQALMLLLVKYDVPDVVRAHVLDVVVDGASLDDVRELFVPGSRGARHLVSLLASIASYEGLRTEMRGRVEAFGRELGLGDDLVRVLIEEAQVSVSAVLRGDESTLRRLRWLRYAIFDMGAPA